MKKSFLVVYEKGKRNYSGFAPDVVGCGSLGNTLEEMRANLQEALQLYFDTSAELGFELPEPTSTSVTLPIEGETDPNTTYVVERISVTVPHKSRRPASASKTVNQRTKVAAPRTKRRTLQVA